MNQYIIAEELLQEAMENTTWGRTNQQKFRDKLTPYQSERDKVLDELIRRIEFRFEDTNQGRGVVGVMREMINKYKEELRQAGES